MREIARAGEKGAEAEMKADSQLNREPNVGFDPGTLG